MPIRRKKKEHRLRIAILLWERKDGVDGRPEYRSLRRRTGGKSGIWGPYFPRLLTATVRKFLGPDRSPRLYAPDGVAVPW